MAITAAQIITLVRGMLNDPSGAVYPDTPVYNLMNKAYKELQLKVTALGISTTKEITSSPVDVPAGTLRLADGALLPADLIVPITLYERADGSTSEFDFVEMQEQEWEPNEQPGTALNCWVWREDEIKFRGATTAREVKIRYLKGLGSIIDGNSPIFIISSEGWIAQRTAALAALLLGSNPTRSAALDADLKQPGGLWDDLKAVLTKRKGNIPVRRRRTRYRVP